MRVDERNLEAARRGDPEALDRLVGQCGPDLRRYAARHCRTGADADDAVQESMILLARRLPALRSLGAFAAWIFQVVRRECLRLERRLFRRDVPLDAERDLAPRDDLDLRIDVVRAITSLPDHYRDAIVLRDFKALSIREIADRLGLLPETVKTRIHRGRALIREHLLS